MRGARPVSRAVEGSGEHAIGEDAPVLALEQLAEEEKVACHLRVGGWHDAVVVFLLLGEERFALRALEPKRALCRIIKISDGHITELARCLSVPFVKRGLVHVEAGRDSFG